MVFISLPVELASSPNRRFEQLKATSPLVRAARSRRNRRVLAALAHAGHRAHLWRDGAATVHGVWQSFLPARIERTDCVINRADLQLRDFALRRMARAGMGRDARAHGSYP